MTGTAHAQLYTAAEASRLAQALLAFLGRKNGIRVLAIKGETASLEGLRPPKASSDADVLVDPAEFDALLGVLAEQGWHPRLVPLEPNVVSPHSVALVNADWPCDIDVHRHYPGFLESSAKVFEELWAHRTVLRIADSEVESVGRAGGLLILALHDLRAPHAAGSAERLATLATTALETFDRAELVEVVALARSTRAVEPARDFLSSLGFAPAAQLPVGNELSEWRALTHSPNRTILWLRELGRVPLRSKPRVLWHALVSSEPELRAQHSGVGAGAPALLVLRLKRIAGGVRALPKAVRALAADRLAERSRRRRSPR